MTLACRGLGFARGPGQNDLHQSGCDFLPPNHGLCLWVDSKKTGTDLFNR
jgi:hypothetical protein